MSARASSTAADADAEHLAPVQIVKTLQLLHKSAVAGGGEHQKSDANNGIDMPPATAARTSPTPGNNSNPRAKQAQSTPYDGTAPAVDGCLSRAVKDIAKV
jgi:hypothetical protein